MADEKVTTRVVFKILEKEAIAFLMDMDANQGNVLSYMHIGQHGEADWNCFRSCRLAKPEQYQELMDELISIGYDLQVRTKWNVDWSKR